MKNEEKAEVAKALYLGGGKTLKEIAGIVGWSQKSVQSRKTTEKWDELKREKNLTKQQIITMLHSQMLAMMNTAREEDRLLSVREIDGIAKISAACDRIEKKQNVEDYIEVFEAFNKWLAPIDHTHLLTSNKYQDLFISKLINESK